MSWRTAPHFDRPPACNWEKAVVEIHQMTHLHGEFQPWHHKISHPAKRVGLVISPYLSGFQDRRHVSCRGFWGVNALFRWRACFNGNGCGSWRCLRHLRGSLSKQRRTRFNWIEQRGEVRPPRPRTTCRPLLPPPSPAWIPSPPYMRLFHSRTVRLRSGPSAAWCS